MSLTIKEKELVYIGASVASGCKPCTSFHYKKALQKGASDEEIKTAISAGRAIGISDAEIYSVLMRAGVRVKGEAASHVDRIADIVSNGISSDEKSISNHGCGCEEDSVESRNLRTLHLH